MVYPSAIIHRLAFLVPIFNTHKMSNPVNTIINETQNPISDPDFAAQSKHALDTTGVLVLKNFLSRDALQSIKTDGINNKDKAYYTSSTHNVYLAPNDNQFDDQHPRNRAVTSSKGCITTDQIPSESLLHSLYKDNALKSFLCAVLNENALYEYADNLSSINLHYASHGQELGWHFDNSSFAITLLIEKPDDGGIFEFVKDARDADNNNMNYELVEQVLNKQVDVSQLDMHPGDLVLFRGRNSMHRVTPTIGNTTRMLVVLAYNTEPGVSLSESARQTFYGRLS